MMFYKFRQCQAVVHKLVIIFFIDIQEKKSKNFEICFKKILEENIKKINKTLEVVDIDPAEKSGLDVKLHELNFGN